MPDLTIKPVAAAGNKLILQDQAGGAVLTTADSGATLSNNTQDNITRLGTVTAGTIKNTIHTDATFPAGHHLQTFWDSLSYSSNPSLDISGSSGSDAMGSSLEVTITPKSTSNVLNVRCFIPDLYNHATNTRSLMAGFRYSAASNFSSSATLGERVYPCSHELYTSAGGALLGNLAYEVWIAPPNTSAIWIRPWLKSTNDAAFRIFANAGAGSGLSDRETAYLSVTEIQQ